MHVLFTAVLGLAVGGALAHDSYLRRLAFPSAPAHAKRPAVLAAAPSGASITAPPLAGAAACNWTHSSAGYWESCGGGAGNLGRFSGLTPAAAQTWCCSNSTCAGFSFGCDDAGCTTGSGYYKANVDCGFITSTDQGWVKPSRLPVEPNVTLTVTAPALPLPSTAGPAVANITLAFTFTSGAPNASTDWVGQVCVGYPIEDYLEFAPINIFSGWNHTKAAVPGGATGGGGASAAHPGSTGSSGSGTYTFTFPVFRSRCDFEFRYFRGKQPLWPSGVVLAASQAVSWEGPDWGVTPFHTHLAYGGEDAQHSMVVSFTTNASAPPGGVTVQLGAAPGVYDLPNGTDIESVTYGADDLCNAPANTTGTDYWQPPGTFWHVTLHGLQPATRYYARPVAGGVPGAEVTFVTGKPLGPDIPVTFASYGDMSVTMYVLDGDTEHDTVDGGPGAVGTALRLRQRIDTAGDVDFVAHYGDLGYAKGAVFLWDAWMSMMTLVGSAVPYMVSVGNHEYDYRYPSPNDPSGAGAMWKPSWWDGDVDSLGECGVGTDVRFRSPRTGNRIFWYTFSSGAMSLVTLSSEHDLSPGSPQGEWLESTLASVNRSLTPWVVVSFHRMVYSLTGSEQAQQDGFRALLEPVFLRHGVDLVMNGHLHSSQRTCAVVNYTCDETGPVYIISGSSGAMLETAAIDDPTSLVRFYNDRSCGFYVVSIANATHARLTWTRNADGAVLDDAWVVRQR